jgi:hypothetical protein
MKPGDRCAYGSNASAAVFQCGQHRLQGGDGCTLHHVGRIAVETMLITGSSAEPELTARNTVPAG